MSRTLLFLFMIALWMPNGGFAQERVPNLIELHDGSELLVFLEPINLESRRLEYRTEPNGKKQRLKLEQVKQIHGTNQTGEPVVFNVMKDYHHRNDRFIEFVLVKPLIEGYMSVFVSELRDGYFRYYIQKRPDDPRIYYFLYAKPTPEQDQDKFQRMYSIYLKRALPVFFGDHPGIMEDFQSGEIFPFDLEKLVIRYNQSKANP